MYVVLQEEEYLVFCFWQRSHRHFGVVNTLLDFTYRGRSMQGTMKWRREFQSRQHAGAMSYVRET